MKMLLKSRRLYKCPILEPWRLDGVAGSKKLQSQNFKSIQKSCDWSVTKHAIFVFQKSPAQMMKRTFLDMLPDVAYFEPFPSLSIFRGVRNGWIRPHPTPTPPTGGLLVYFFLISNGIFSSEKCLQRPNRPVLTRKFYKQNIRFEPNIF